MPENTAHALMPDRLSLVRCAARSSSTRSDVCAWGQTYFYSASKLPIGVPGAISEGFPLARTGALITILAPTAKPPRNSWRNKKRSPAFPRVGTYHYHASGMPLLLQARQCSSHGAPIKGSAGGDPCEVGGEIRLRFRDSQGNSGTPRGAPGVTATTASLAAPVLHACGARVHRDGERRSRAREGGGLGAGGARTEMYEVSCGR